MAINPLLIMLGDIPLVVAKGMQMLTQTIDLLGKIVVFLKDLLI